MSDILMDLCKAEMLEKIKADAVEEGFKNGYNEGFEAGHECIMSSFDNACIVTKVVYEGFNTHVYFADSTDPQAHETVTFNPEYGYDYDPEKAIMAAMLKHLCGSVYIKSLRRFGVVTDPECEALFIGDIDFKNMKRNVSTAMIERTYDDYYDDFDDNDIDLSYEINEKGDFVNLSEDEILLREIALLESDDVMIEE